MSTYGIKQYELYTRTYRVEAATAAEAVAVVLRGGGEEAGNTLEYAEVAESDGLLAYLHPNLSEPLREQGFEIAKVIPSICSVTKIYPGRAGNE